MAAVALAVEERAAPRKLRVGLFAASQEQPRWLVEAFDKVAQSDFAEVVVVRTHGVKPDRGPLLWQLYSTLDRRIFRGDDSTDPVDIQIANLAQSSISESGSDPDWDLDVAFVLDDEYDDSHLDGVARYGVWRFCFAGWNEVARGAPVTGSGITVRLARRAPRRLAYQSWSRTYPLSVARNRARLARKTGEFAWRALRELHRSGHGWLEQCRVVDEIPPAGRKPSRTEALKTVSGIAARVLQRGLQKALYVDQWFLAWRFRDSGEPDARRIAPGLEGYTRAIPPRDRIWADPFAIEKNGRHFVFFEELPFAAGKAHISMIEVKRDGSWSAPVRVLERGYHLSYPFLLEHDGELYMIPESAQNRSVDLFRCVDFPLGWKLEKSLIQDVRLVDATLHRGADGWWMFANGAASGSSVFDDELHLFHSDSLLGTWRAHERNPVMSDARCARPAGRLFWRGGALYRPSQICVPRYGAGLSINRVLRLTAQHYAEREVEQIFPGGGLLGLHTLNCTANLTVIDAFARRSRFQE